MNLMTKENEDINHILEQTPLVHHLYAREKRIITFTRKRYWALTTSFYLIENQIF